MNLLNRFRAAVRAWRTGACPVPQPTPGELISLAQWLYDNHPTEGFDDALRQARDLWVRLADGSQWAPSEAAAPDRSVPEAPFPSPSPRGARP